MWFTVGDKQQEHSLKEIEKQRDRGAGIIATAVLQDHLVRAIKTRLDTGSAVEAQMFSASGALGNFGAQIDLGFLLGFYTENDRRMLHDIRMIRNDFAHNATPVSFSSQRERCLRIRQTGYSKWLVDAVSIASGLKIKSPRIRNTPRAHFLSGVRYLTTIIALELIKTRGTRKDWIKEPEKAPRPPKGPRRTIRKRRAAA